MKVCILCPKLYCSRFTGSRTNTYAKRELTEVSLGKNLTKTTLYCSVSHVSAGFLDVMTIFPRRRSNDYKSSTHGIRVYIAQLTQRIRYRYEFRFPRGNNRL